MTNRQVRRFKAGALSCVLVALLSACSSDAATDAETTGVETTSAETTSAETTVVAAADTSSEEAFPVTITAGNGPVTIAARPAAIISLSATATETLYAIGAGDQVKAVDDQSNFPAESAAKKSKLSGFEPNIEAIAAEKPDLVIISDDSKGIAAALGKLSIPTMLQAPAATLDDVYAQIEQLGAATGNLGNAAALVATMQSDIDAATSGLPTSDTPVTMFHEIDKTGYTATSATFIGALYKMVGFTNVADAVGDTTGYPQMTTEAVVAANPQVIFLSNVLYGESAATVTARQGWADIDAVKNGKIVELDSDVASRWGPRTVDLLKAIAAAKSAVPVASAAS